MNIMRVPPAWRLPQGVDAPLWEYTHTSRLAAEEDAYFANHPLFQADERTVDERFVEPGRLIDLGCGAGRHSLRFARRGFSVTAVDLSRPMLEMVALKAAESGVELTTVQSNLCRLGCFPDQIFDYALSMFSTLGMIRGRESRRRALAEARRILRPAVGLRSTFIISGSISAIPRVEAGSGRKSGRHCSTEPIWAIAA